MAADISVAEWLKDLEQMSSRNDEGMTSQEIRKQCGLSKDKLREKLQEATALGWVRLGKRSWTRVDGVVTTKTVYRFVKPEAK